MPGDATEFDKTKPESFPCRNRGGVFVHARRQPERVREFEPPQPDRQLRSPKETVEKLAAKGRSTHRAEGFDGEIVDLLGIEGEQERPNDVAINQSIYDLRFIIDH